MRLLPLALLPILLASPAYAGDLRDLCPDRPGLGTPPCTLDSGHAMIEIGAADWTLERDAGTRTDTWLAGDALLRVGVADHAEVQIGWTPYGHVRTRDRATGAVDRMAGSGDVTVALRRNLLSPDGSGMSIALMPHASLPTGGHAIGAGDWGGGLLVPMSFDLGHALSLALTPEVDAAVDEDRHGRHLAYGSVVGLGLDITEAVSATMELEVLRDEDPSGHSTQALAGLALAWQASDDVQFDVGSNLGLHRDSPDVELYFGIARRF